MGECPCYFRCQRFSPSILPHLKSQHFPQKHGNCHPDCQQYEYDWRSHAVLQGCRESCRCEVISDLFSTDWAQHFSDINKLTSNNVLRTWNDTAYRIWGLVWFVSCKHAPPSSKDGNYIAHSAVWPLTVSSGLQDVCWQQVMHGLPLQVWWAHYL